MKNLLAGLLLGTIAVTASAGTMGLDIGSWHSRPGFNNFNPGVYYIADNRVAFGTYYNSYRRQTVWAGYAFENGPFALVVGGATGYDYAPITPVVAPGLVYSGFRLTIVPKVSKVNDVTAVHLSYEFKF